jgi:hypothetical protein
VSDTEQVESDLKDVDSFRERVREHGRTRAVLESFAYVQPFGGMFGKWCRCTPSRTGTPWAG